MSLKIIGESCLKEKGMVYEYLFINLVLMESISLMLDGKFRIKFNKNHLLHLFKMEVKMTICVVGHSNPDTDSVTAAIALAAYLNAKGEEAKACMQTTLEDLNPESKMVLERFGLQAPEAIEDAAGKNRCSG